MQGYFNAEFGLMSIVKFLNYILKWIDIKCVQLQGFNNASK